MLFRSGPRIVSLSPALTHMVEALGAGDRVVGCTPWCGVAGARVVGSLEDRDLEPSVQLAYEYDLQFLSDTSDPEMQAMLQQLAEFNNQLMAARIKRAEAELRENQVRSLQRSQGNIETAAVVLENPLIQRLRETEIQLERKIGELKTQFRDQHPKMQLAQTELEDLQSKLKIEINKIAAHLSNEVQLTKTRESNLQTEVDRLRQRLIEQNEIESHMRGLESELRANRQLYETFVGRLQATRVQDDEIGRAHV